MSKPSPTPPLVIATAFIVAGLVIAAVGGFSSGSTLGGVVAGLGAIPGCWGAWTGMQQETQGSLALSLLLVLASLGIGALLIVLDFVDWLR